MKENKEVYDNRISMLQRKYNKIYLDILKHSNDIERWISIGNRKSGDIRRSLEKLVDKYNQLCEVKTKLKKEYLTENDIFNSLPIGAEKYNLNQINEKINKLYYSAGIENTRQFVEKNRYKKTIDIINDVPGYNKRDTELILEEDNNQEYMAQHDKPIKDSKIRKILQKFKDNLFNFNKTTSKLAAISLAGIIAIFGGATIGESNSNVKTENTKSYTETETHNRDKAFKESLYVETKKEEQPFTDVEIKTKTVSEIYSEKSENKKTIKSDKEEDKKTKSNKEKQKKNNKVTKNNKSNTKHSTASKRSKNKEMLNEGNEIYIINKGERYTEVSDGTGNVGYFNKDSKVKIYNMALVQNNKQGNKNIIIATKPGESWAECAKRKGIKMQDIKKYAQSKDVATCYSLQSEDGKKLYGWVTKDKTNNNQKNNKLEKGRNEGR